MSLEAGMHLDKHWAKKGYRSPGEWEISLRGTKNSPVGLFITTPARRIWIFVSRWPKVS